MNQMEWQLDRDMNLDKIIEQIEIDEVTRASLREALLDWHEKTRLTESEVRVMKGIGKVVDFLKIIDAV